MNNLDGTKVNTRQLSLHEQSILSFCPDQADDINRRAMQALGIPMPIKEES